MSTRSDDDNRRLAPFNPTHESSIDVAIHLLQLQPSDLLFDLGCGDGRMIIRAASRVDGLRCVGIELDESLVARGRDMVIAKTSADKAALSDRVEIRNGDVLAEMKMIGQTPSPPPPPPPPPQPENDKGVLAESKLTLLDDATAVFVYLLPQGLKKVKVLIEEAAKRRRLRWGLSDAQQQPALRVCSYMFSIPGLAPVQVDRSGKGSCPIYLYHL